MKFSRENVDSNVGKVWNALNSNGELSLKELEEKTEIKKDELLIAIGWLIHEDKIISNGKKTAKLILK